VWVAGGPLANQFKQSAKRANDDCEAVTAIVQGFSRRWGIQFFRFPNALLPGGRFAHSRHFELWGGPKGRAVVQRSDTIETERLRLRPISGDDLEPLAALGADREVMRYIGAGKPQTRREAGKWFDLLLAEAATGPAGPPGLPGWRVVTSKSSGDWIGLAALKCLAEQHAEALGIESAVELGYRLARRYWGQGYATELSRALISHAFEHVGLTQLVAIADARNMASNRVLEKAGLVYRQTYAINGRTIRFFALTDEEYRQRQPA
jgi:[ribosomal protein S5]-alanine N-acetyltransferase